MAPSADKGGGEKRKKKTSATRLIILVCGFGLRATVGSISKGGDRNSSDLNSLTHNKNDDIPRILKYKTWFV